MLTSLRKLWVKVSKHSIAPWVVLILTGVYTFGRWEADVSAQSRRIEELHENSRRELSELKSNVEQETAAMHRVVIDRLDDIKEGQRDLGRKLDDAQKDLDRVKDRVREVSSDLAIVCSRVEGSCRQR